MFLMKKIPIEVEGFFEQGTGSTIQSNCLRIANANAIVDKLHSDYIASIYQNEKSVDRGSNGKKILLSHNPSMPCT